jgi:hypothetical protein
MLPMDTAPAIRRLTDCATLPFMSATPGPAKTLPGIQGADPRTQDQSTHTHKPVFAPPAKLNVK